MPGKAVLARQSAQLSAALEKVEHHLSFELEAEAPVPCHGLSSDKPGRPVQSILPQLSSFWGSLHLSFLYGADHALAADRLDACLNPIKEFLEQGEQFIISRESQLIHP
jgi:hypothetical protein